MRCKVGSIHRLLDLYGWAQLGHAAITVSTPKPPAGPWRGLGGLGGGFPGICGCWRGVGGVRGGFGVWRGLGSLGGWGILGGF